MNLTDSALNLLIVAVVLLHLLAAPHTKVEESFNIQATHDILIYGAPGFFSWGELRSTLAHKLSSFDHSAFPGAVPRTFLGPLILAEFSRYLVPVFGFQHAQLLARALLGLFNASALIFFKKQVQTACGSTAARWYAVLQASQFHIMFYASRTLPNMFAFGLSEYLALVHQIRPMNKSPPLLTILLATFAFGLLLPSKTPSRSYGRIKLSIMLFTFSAVVFRSEVALLLAINACWLLIIPIASLTQLIRPFAASFVLSLALSVPIDSYYWQKYLWPELWGFYYNVVQGSSSNWGTSPWHYYLASALPKLLLNPLTLILIAVALYSPATNRIAQRLVIPNLVFVAIYSLQPHKEARFIFYVVPPLTAAAALGAASLTPTYIPKDKSEKNKSNNDGPVFKQITILVVAFSVLGSFLISTGMLLTSSLNYPGGEALAVLKTIVQHDHVGTASPSLVTFHADVLSCMTGVTLFGVAGGDNVPTRHNFPDDSDLIVSDTCSANQGEPSAWLLLDKTEDERTLRTSDFWLRFDYLLMEDEAVVKGGQWETVAVVEGLAGIEILRPGVEAQQSEPVGVQRVGTGARYVALRDWARRLTGGWWLGPRLAPKIHIMKRIKETAAEADRAGKVTVVIA
ncbi:Alg9-like mannosyltransferase family-domain-containing protein [Coniella lustricola]|uniref:Mannosyltransferase n=1 Tax=Coniella lustricola TaxID=2025994 RepID=A0A2T3AGW6_9PEZI|nr:Alg9-like mannosyltransferase family-domain-containing protein [Coniella lustricola]